MTGSLAADVAAWYEYGMVESRFSSYFRLYWLRSRAAAGLYSTQ